IRAGFVKQSRTRSWRTSSSRSRVSPSEIQERPDAQCARPSNANTGRRRPRAEPFTTALRRGIAKGVFRVRPRVLGQTDRKLLAKVGNLRYNLFPAKPNRASSAAH